MVRRWVAAAAAPLFLTAGRVAHAAAGAQAHRTEDTHLGLWIWVLVGWAVVLAAALTVGAWYRRTYGPAPSL